MSPVPNALSQNDVDTPTAPVDRWEIAVVTRHGKPPLRFKGQRRAYMRRKILAHDALSIALWARRKGDFVLAYSDVSSMAPKSDALVFPKQFDAVEHLEALCADQSMLNRHSDIPVALSQILQTLGKQQQFAILVGDFLAKLDSNKPPTQAFPPQQRSDDAARKL